MTLKKFTTTFALILMFLIAMPAKAQEAGTVRLAAYNIENAFDVYDNPYTRDEGTAVKPRREYEGIAAALRNINADVVSFEEVENEAVLQALVDEYLPDMGYDHVAVPLTNDGRGISLGLISRLPILSITSYRWQTLTLPGTNQTWHFARDLLQAKLELPGHRVLNVFVVHLKSKADSRNDPKSIQWRTSEALRIHQIIGDMLAQNPDELIALMGDFNSEPTQPAIATLLAPGPDGKPFLFDSHRLIPQQDRTTYPSEAHPNSVIDYIFASPALASRLIPESARIINDPELTKGSDHYPITAAFDLSR